MIGTMASKISTMMSKISQISQTKALIATAGATFCVYSMILKLGKQPQPTKSSEMSFAIQNGKTLSNDSKKMFDFVDKSKNYYAIIDSIIICADSKVCNIDKICVMHHNGDDDFDDNFYEEHYFDDGKLILIRKMDSSNTGECIEQTLFLTKPEGFLKINKTHSFVCHHIYSNGSEKRIYPLFSGIGPVKMMCENVELDISKI